MENNTFLFHFQRLPQEVVVMIFEKLPIRILLLLEECGDWLKDTVLAVRYGNLDRFESVPHFQLAKFIAPRREILSHLNLDDLWGLNINKLNALRYCRSLRSLSLVNTDFHIFDLFDLMSYVHLEELSCSLGIGHKGYFFPQPEIYFSNNSHLEKLKKANIYVLSLKLAKFFLYSMLIYCSNLSELTINFLETCIWEEQIYVEKTCLNESPTLPLLSTLVIGMVGTKLLKKRLLLDKFLLPILTWTFAKRSLDASWKKLWICLEDCEELYEACKWNTKNVFPSPCLCLHEKLFDNDELVDALKKRPSESVRHLLLSVDSSLNNIVSSIVHAGGKELKQLQMISKPKSSIFQHGEQFRGLLFQSCSNIVVLDLQNFHMSSICSAISSLKSLRSLSLRFCALHVNAEPSKHELDPPKKRICHGLNSEVKTAMDTFKLMVESCPHVEYFFLKRCNCTQIDFTGVDIILTPVYKWLKLKHIRLSTGQACNLPFLMTVANSCKQLHSLELIKEDVKCSCLFMPSLLHILEKSKKLAYLWIYHESFPINDNRFWNVLPKAKSLESMCIRTNFRMSVSMRQVTSKISMLPRLRIFHISTASEEIVHRSRQVIARKMNISTQSVPSSSHICHSSHFYRHIMLKKHLGKSFHQFVWH